MNPLICRVCILMLVLWLIPAVPAITVDGNNPVNTTLELRIANLTPGESLPAVYTCSGQGISPAVSWGPVPENTRSLLLIMDDPDAPAGTFTHWILSNISPDSRSIPEGTHAGTHAMAEGKTTAGKTGYFPPCPPAGSAHRYTWTLYALDSQISLPGADQKAADTAIGGHIIGIGTAETRYRAG